MRAAPNALAAFRPPARRRVHEDIAEQLRDAILDGRYQAGDKLPPERDLAAEFEVTRTTVREALKVLEGLGLIRTRQGDGATVQAPIEGSADLLGPMVFRRGRVDPRALADLAEVMQVLLREMARLAVDRYEPPDLERLAAARRLLADPGRDRETRLAAARDIVVVLSDMTRNRVWQMLARQARRLLATPPFRGMRRRISVNPDGLVGPIDRALAALREGRSEPALAEVHTLIANITQPGTAVVRREGRRRRGPGGRGRRTS